MMFAIFIILIYYYFMGEHSIGRVLLRGISGNYNSIDYNIDKNEFLIGRHFRCDLVLAENTVSAEHAKIVKDGKGYKIADLDSSNGTFVNGEKVTGERYLRTEDKIAIDKIEFRFVNHDDVAKTVISDGKEFRESMKTEIRENPDVFNSLPDKSDTNPVRIEEVKSAIKKKEKYDQRMDKTQGFFSGLLSGLAMAYLINLGILFLLRSVNLTSLSLSGLWNSFAFVISGFPYLHSHSYWTRVPGKNIFDILAGILIPLGLLLSGMVIQRARGGNPLKNAIRFSFFYGMLFQFIQISVMRFSFSSWVSFWGNFNVGITFTDQITAISVALIYFFLFSLLFSFTGTLLVKRK